MSPGQRGKEQAASHGTGPRRAARRLGGQQPQRPRGPLPTEEGSRSDTVQVPSRPGRTSGGIDLLPLLPKGTSLKMAGVRLGMPTVAESPIPFDQPGAVAGKQYQGDGQSVVRTTDGAQFRCVWQDPRGGRDPHFAMLNLIPL